MLGKHGQPEIIMHGSLTEIVVHFGRARNIVDVPTEIWEAFVKAEAATGRKPEGCHERCVRNPIETPEELAYVEAHAELFDAITESLDADTPDL